MRPPTFRKDMLGAPSTIIESASSLGPDSRACKKGSGARKQGLDEDRVASRPWCLLDEAETPPGCQGGVSPWLSGVTARGVWSFCLRLWSRLHADRLEERPASVMIRGRADPDCLARIDCNSESASWKLGLQFGVGSRAVVSACAY